MVRSEMSHPHERGSFPAQADYAATASIPPTNLPGPLETVTAGKNALLDFGWVHASPLELRGPGAALIVDLESRREWFCVR